MKKDEKDNKKVLKEYYDWACNCGKYNKVEYKGVVCDRCGAKVTKL